MNPTHDPLREEILDAAAALFEHYSYRKTTVEEIAQKAGVGKGTIYLHFESKEQIGLAWLQRIHQEMLVSLLKTVEGTGSALDRLEEFLVQRVMLRDAIFRQHRRSLDEALESLRGMLDEHRHRFHAQEAALIARLIDESAREGEVHQTSESPDRLGETMVVATNSLLPYRVRTEQVPPRKTIEDHARRVAVLLRQALQKPQETHHG